MATENRAIGSDKQPVRVDKSGKIVPLTGNAGSVANDNLQPIYLLNGELIALTGTSGAYNKPVRVENGVIKPITVTAGNGGDRLIYLDNGEVTNSSKTVGDTNKPVYLKNGVVTQISGNIGSSVQPVFISNGVITGASGNTGSDTKPLKMSGGKLTPVTKDLATVEYVDNLLAGSTQVFVVTSWPSEANMKWDAIYLKYGTMTNVTGNVFSVDLSEARIRSSAMTYAKGTDSDKSLTATLEAGTYNVYVTGGGGGASAMGWN